MPQRQLLTLVGVVIAIFIIGGIALFALSRVQPLPAPTTVPSTGTDTLVAPTTSATGDARQSRVPRTPAPRRTFPPTQTSVLDDIPPDQLATFEVTGEFIEPTMPGSEYFATADADDVALAQFGDINDGTFAIISVTYPANTRISKTPPETYYDWLLVELMATCTGEANCAPLVSSIQTIGDSGTAFPAQTDIGVEPVYNPADILNRQVYGYLAFAVPSGETGLRLLVTQDGKETTYTLR